MLVTCPSGLSFQARKWRIGDRRNLHDQKVIRSGLLMRKMLEAVDEGVESLGPYEDFQQGKPAKWPKVSLVDIVDALLYIRIQSRPELDYNEVCENCGAQIPLTIDLRELEREPMSQEGKDHLSTGEPMAALIPLREPDESNGEEAPIADVKLRMLLGEHMPTLTKHYKQDPTTQQEVQMVMHIVELQAPGMDRPLDRFKDIHKFYAQQDWYFQEKLDDEIAKLGGGTNTLVDMACQRCSAEQQGILPFATEFFYPRKRRSTSSMVTH